MESTLQQLHEVITAVVRDTLPEQLAFRPEGKWSASEILEHLYLSYTGTVKGFDACLRAGKPLASLPTWKQRAGAFLVTGVGYFPNGRKSPRQAQPRGIDPQTVLAGIGPAILKMDELITDCESRYGGGPMLDHPILGPLSAAQWRKLHWLHARHHMKQIDRLKAQCAAKIKPPA